jgi:hypothetical protein
MLWSVQADMGWSVQGTVNLTVLALAAELLAVRRRLCYDF